MRLSGVYATWDCLSDVFIIIGNQNILCKIKGEYYGNPCIFGAPTKFDPFTVWCHLASLLFLLLSCFEKRNVH